MSDYEPSPPAADKLRFLKSPVVHQDDDDDAEARTLQSKADDSSKNARGHRAGGLLPDFVRVRLSSPTVSYLWHRSVLTRPFAACGTDPPRSLL